MEGRVSHAEPRDHAVEIMHLLGYDHPTSLQQKALDNKALFSQLNMLIIGETSTGKTLIPLLVYFERLCQTPSYLPAPKLLYVAPYRSLVAQKVAEITECAKLLCDAKARPHLTVEQSTGEFRQADDPFMNGRVDVAVVITEKVFNFGAETASFFALYDYVVVDETGLVDDEARGTRLDLILLWANAQHIMTGKSRIFALATTSFSWQLYEKSYGFVSIVENDRPVQLCETIVRFPYRPSSQSKCFSFGENCNESGYKDKTGAFVLPAGKFYNPRFINWLESRGMQCMTPCPELDAFCAIRLDSRSDPNVMCSRTREPCMHPARVLQCKINPRKYAIELICRHHLALGHQIIIFQNNREEVRGCCKQLLKSLGDLLPVPEDYEQQAQAMFEECNLTKDDLYGIMEDVSPSKDEDDDVFYQAFAAGIAFHSRAMPQGLRAYIEQRLLEERSLKIVCSTETLAYGVNSSVDVVIVADLIKQSHGVSRVLTANEYRNYIGRAGRLHPNRDVDDVGYVYTLVAESKTGLEALASLEQDLATPNQVQSHLMGKDSDSMPFFALSLLHAREGKTSQTDMWRIVDALPVDAEARKELRAQLGDALNKLEREGLVTSEFDPFEDRLLWELTNNGEVLSGYIITWPDYELIKQALCNSFQGIHDGLVVETLLYELLRSRHMRFELGSGFRTSIIKPSDLYEYFTKRLDGKAALPSWLTTLKTSPNRARIKLYYVLAAVLCWSEGASSRYLVRNFGVQYPLIQSIGQQLDYLLGIARKIAPQVLKEEQRRIFEQSTAFGKYFQGGEREWEQGISSSIELIEGQLSRLALAIYYGIDENALEAFRSFLSDKGDVESAQLVEQVAGQIDPTTARMLRRMSVRYKWFLSEPRRDRDPDIEVRNNYLQQLAQYRRDICAMGPWYVAFFEEKFPENFIGRNDRS